jgi:hypothetical protein
MWSRCLLDGQTRYKFVVEYVSKTLLPLLVLVFHFLIPTSNGMTVATLVDDSIFGAMTLNATIVHMLLKNELGLFCHLHVKPKDFVLPLIWWKSHETQFPNVSFVV